MWAVPCTRASTRSTRRSSPTRTRCWRSCRSTSAGLLRARRSTTTSSRATPTSRRSSSTRRRTRRRPRSCRWSPLVPEARQDPRRGRPPAAAVDGQPRPARRTRACAGPTSRAFTPRRVAAMEPRIRATVDELLDAVDAARAVRPRRRRSRSRCRRASIFSLHGRARARTGRSSRTGAATAPTLAWGRPGARASRSSTRATWPPTAATCASSSRARPTTAPTTTRARCSPSTTRTRRRSPTRRSPRSCSRSASPATRRRTT